MEQPTAPEDQGRAWPDLVASTEALIDRLRSADDLLTVGADGEAPPGDLMNLLIEAEEHATLVKIRTHVEHAISVEAELLDIRRMIQDAASIS